MLANDDRRRADDYATHRERSEAPRGTLGDLRGKRLGAREREILLAVTSSGFSRDDSIVGGYPLPCLGSRSERNATLTAAKRLHDLGLLDYRKRVYVTRGVYVALTPLGREVAATYRHEMETGRPIRWPTAA